MHMSMRRRQFNSRLRRNVLHVGDHLNKKVVINGTFSKLFRIPPKFCTIRLGYLSHALTAGQMYELR